jgi:CRP-like cAMP-binding protein
LTASFLRKRRCREIDSSAFFQYPSDTAGDARFLGDLREDEIRAVLSYTQARRYPQGEPAIREGDIEKSLFVITEGRFEIVKRAAYGARRTTVLQPGEIFGVLTFLDHQPTSTGARGG